MQGEAVKAEALKKEGKGKGAGLGKTSIGYLVKKKIGFPATIVWQGMPFPPPPLPPSVDMILDEYKALSNGDAIRARPAIFVAQGRIDLEVSL